MPVPTSKNPPLRSGAMEVNSWASAENSRSGPDVNASLAGSKIWLRVLSGTESAAEVLPPMTIACPSGSAVAT